MRSMKRIERRMKQKKRLAACWSGWLIWHTDVTIAQVATQRCVRCAPCYYTRTCYQNPPSPPLDNIRVMVIVWRLRGNIIRTAPCWVVWHNVHSQQHTHMSSSFRSSRLGLSHWDPYAMHRGGCLELYYCNMVEWSLWDSSLIWKTSWFPSVHWHCWFGHITCKSRPRYDL